MTEPTNAHGPGYGCACVSRDARTCSALRSGGYYYRDEDCCVAVEERCECQCHEWDGDGDGDGGRKAA